MGSIRRRHDIARPLEGHSINENEIGDFKLEKGLQLKVPKTFRKLFTMWFVFSLGVLLVNLDELEMDQSRLISVYFSRRV